MTSPTDAVFWILFAFFCGSIPFSVLLGKMVLHKDIRRYGDGNPGGTNVIRAGGKTLGVVAILLDGLKGALPVGAAYWIAGLSGPALAAVALAPVLGHACSPFLGLRGGKAVAVTFGIWAGLTLWQGPTILGICLAFFYWLITPDGWAVLFTMLGLLLYLLVVRSMPLFLLIWAGNTVLLVWTHRADLAQRPDLRRAEA